MKRTPIRRISAKRQTALQEYSAKREVFLARLPKCEACKTKKSRDVHHMHGRLGGNYLNEKTWMSVCRTCHDYIHTHPKDSRAKGWLA